MANTDNTNLGPPPLATPVVEESLDQFGVPFHLRTDKPPRAGDIQVGWGAWFSRLFEALWGMFSPLIDAGRLVMVGSKYGTLAESAVTDNGTTVTSTEPVMVTVTVSGGTQPGITLDTTATAKARVARLTNNNRLDLLQNLSYDGANFNLDDTAKDGVKLSLNTDAARVLQVQFAAAGPNPVALVNYVVIDLAGYVGIGVNPPAYQLDVVGDINTATLYRCGGTAGVTASKTYINSITWNYENTALRGTPGAGQSQFSAVIGAIMTSGTVAATGGIVTTLT